MNAVTKHKDRLHVGEQIFLEEIQVSKRLNIGLFIDDIDAVFTSEAVKGAELGAIAADVNLFIFPGMYLDTADISDDHTKYEYQFNTLFQYVSEKHIDVLYIMMGMIGCRISEQERYKFLEQYTGIPVVILYTRMDGYQSLVFDNKGAFMQGIRHLIRDHHASRIGYVSGPVTNVDAMERFDAYKAVLAEENIPYRDDYVIYGNFEESTGEKVGKFVDEHKELEALVFANDRMAHGSYDVLARKGIRIGQDILVIGFDNSDFAATLFPSLTTVEANAAELAYKAVMSAEKVVKTGKLDSLETDTHLVMRSSCGCLSFDHQSMPDRMGLTDLVKLSTADQALEKINEYLFNVYIAGEDMIRVREELNAFIRMLIEMVELKQYEGKEKEIINIYSKLLSGSLFRYTTVEKVTNVFMALHHELVEKAEDDRMYRQLTEIFVDFYRELAIMNGQVIQGQQAGMERMSRQINSMTVDMFRMDSGERIPYERALKDLSNVGIDSAFLYTFVENIYHEKGTAFTRPEKLNFRAWYAENEIHSAPEGGQIIDTEDLFAPERLPQDRRLTLVLTPMFSCEELYGILISEVHYQYFKNIMPVTMQISVALKSLLLLEQQENVQRKLEENMAKILDDNNMLSEMSRTDQLTGLYNRWGFLEHVKNIVDNPENNNRKALVLYADMDGLKAINDGYGHDMGDLALKGISNILKETFCDKDVVARFGGDEFVAFTLADDYHQENNIKKKIAELVKLHNDASDNEFYIDMSTGICEVDCEPGMNIYKVLADADRKLYQEKREKKLGRNTKGDYKDGKR